MNQMQQRFSRQGSEVSKMTELIAHEVGKEGVEGGAITQKQVASWLESARPLARSISTVVMASSETILRDDDKIPDAQSPEYLLSDEVMEAALSTLPWRVPYAPTSKAIRKLRTEVHDAYATEERGSEHAGRAPSIELSDTQATHLLRKAYPLAESLLVFSQQVGGALSLSTLALLGRALVNSQIKMISREYYAALEEDREVVRAMQQAWDDFSSEGSQTMPPVPNR